MDPRLPPREDCVLRYMLDKWVERCPDKIFVVFENGQELSYAQFAARVRVRAQGLRDLGVRQSDHVLVWLPNGPECLISWFAINYLGAVYVPINTAYKGGVLEHAIAISDARLALVHTELLPRLESVQLAGLERVVMVSGQIDLALPGIELVHADRMDAPQAGGLELERAVEPWDPQCIIYTSGTTGPSKGVMTSYVQLYESGKCMPLATGDDRFMVTLPLFHAGCTIGIYRLLAFGGSIVLLSAFSTDTFWKMVCATRTTSLLLLGVMANFLAKRPLRDGEASDTLDWVLAVPLDADAIEFGRRFGVTVTTAYNMTETSTPIVSDVNPTLPGSCGTPREGAEVRLVDENDCEVADGEVGEMIVRTDMPWAMNSGYYRNPEATARAWRNGWFHTGDAFRKNEEGQFFFVDRMKDAIRRRGENISSFEVEAEVIAHAAVREVAAVAVPSELNEDELLIALSLAEGASLDPAELIEFLRPRMAHFMIPRYVRIVDDLPKTPTQKVQKHVIRSQGVTPDTWDREKAGVVVRRDRLSG